MGIDVKHLKREWEEMTEPAKAFERMKRNWEFDAQIQKEQSAFHNKMYGKWTKPFIDFNDLEIPIAKRKDAFYKWMLKQGKTEKQAAVATTRKFYNEEKFNTKKD